MKGPLSPANVGAGGPPAPGPLNATLRWWFGEDLPGLLEAIGGVPTRAEALTRFVSCRRRKASFRVHFNDGRVLKLRLHLPGRNLEDYRQLAALLDPLPFARCLAVCGRASVEEWLPGDPLAIGLTTERQAMAAGALLARLHNCDVAGALPSSRLPAVADYVDCTEGRLASLQSMGVLLAEDVRGVRERALAEPPAGLVTGLVHGDFGPDNLIVDPAGRIHGIDTESLQLGALHYDLARSWVRWSLDDGLWESFLEGYGVLRGQAMRGQGLFWVALALAESIFNHVQYARPCDDMLGALRHLARGESGSALPSLWQAMP